MWPWAWSAPGSLLSALGTSSTRSRPCCRHPTASPRSHALVGLGHRRCPWERYGLPCVVGSDVPEGADVPQLVGGGYAHKCLRLGGDCLAPGRLRGMDSLSDPARGICRGPGGTGNTGSNGCPAKGGGTCEGGRGAVSASRSCSWFQGAGYSQGGRRASTPSPQSLSRSHWTDAGW